MEAIKVRIVEFGDRKHYQMQFRDPTTGRKQTRSTGIERTGRKRERTDAERVAAKWESELREGRYRCPSKVSWVEFRERYENEVLSSLAETTDRKVTCVFNVLERNVNPVKLRDLTAARLSAHQAKLREQGRSESTIKGHLAHLAAALQWAVRVGLLPIAPTIDVPRRAKGSKIMKGRPVSGEEFDRLLLKVEAGLLSSKPCRERQKQSRKPKRVFGAAAVEKLQAKRQAVVAAAVASWEHYLRGLWLSGLRLAESMELCWDRDDKLCVDLSGKRPMLRIPAELEKGNQDRLLPMAPEFAEFLLTTPDAERTGYVFNPKPLRGSNRPTEERVGEYVSSIGRAAGVKVNTDPTTGKVKFASAHDLRRSFGERWSSRVMPQVLMILMRHENIETTMRYYVGRNAQTTADVLWAAHENAITGNTSGNTGLESPRGQTARTGATQGAAYAFQSNPESPVN